MDPEIIRKAAEALWAAHSRGYKVGPMGIMVASGRDDSPPFEPLQEETKQYWTGLAEAALKVFLEHTRSQPREQTPPKCEDCGEQMRPTATGYACVSCGGTAQG